MQNKGMKKGSGRGVYHRCYILGQEVVDVHFELVLFYLT